MDLNQIKLTSQQVADLYSNVLIESGATVMPASTTIRFLGNNKENILIVVNTDNTVFIADDDLKFLTTVLAACKMSLADVAIINWQNVNADYKSILVELSSKAVLLFGVTPNEFGLPINFPFYQVQRFDERQFVFAPPLSEIGKDVNSKKELWLSLKRLFNI